MTFALILVCSLAACLLLRKPIKHYPLLFYALAAITCVLFFACTYFPISRPVWTMLLLLVQKCMLPLALFVIVMYIGVLPSGSKLYQWLKPIRAELSIVAWILSLGHMAVYLASYAPRILSGSAFNVNVMGSFVLAIVLFVLLTILGVTSFQVVKIRMHADAWKKVQKLAYPFFLLVYLHVLLMLLPSALNGGIASTLTVTVYSCVFIAYIVLRLYRASSDKRSKKIGQA